MWGAVVSIPGRRRLRLREEICRPEATPSFGGRAGPMPALLVLTIFLPPPREGLPRATGPLKEGQQTKATSLHTSLGMAGET